MISTLGQAPTGEPLAMNSSQMHDRIVTSPEAAETNICLEIKVAVFDVCGTLYRSNTTHDFIDFYLRSRSLLKSIVFRVFRCGMFIPAWAAVSRTLRMDVFRLLAVGMLRGSPVECVKQESARFVRSVLPRRQKPAVIALMQQLKMQGYTVVLISASLSIVVEEVASSLGIDTFFACDLESENGLYSGRYAHDIIGEKHRVVDEHFPGCTDLLVVTDNYEDAELVRRASRSWIVCEARKQGRWNGIAPSNARFME